MSKINNIIKREVELRDTESDLELLIFTGDSEVGDMKVVDKVNESFFDEILGNDFVDVNDYYENTIINPLRHLSVFMSMATIIVYVLYYSSMEEYKLLQTLIGLSVTGIFIAFKYLKDIRLINFYKRVEYFRIISNESFNINKLEDKYMRDIVKKDIATFELDCFNMSEYIHDMNEEINKDIRELNKTFKDLKKETLNIELLGLDNFSENFYEIHTVHDISLISIVNYKNHYLSAEHGDIVITTYREETQKKAQVFIIKIDEKCTTPVLEQLSSKNLKVNKTLKMNREYYINNIYPVIRKVVKTEKSIEFIDKLKDLD